MAENSLYFNLGDLERLAPEEVFNLLDGMTEEEALNSDVEGDSNAEDNLVYDTPVNISQPSTSRSTRASVSNNSKKNGVTEGSDGDYHSDDSINDPKYEPEESSSRGNFIQQERYHLDGESDHESSGTEEIESNVQESLKINWTKLDIRPPKKYTDFIFDQRLAQSIKIHAKPHQKF
ncbi:hypothetical protein QE152_g32513 [Popillia japonica]|uniref:Uncharacterized protein n=1 Tax=Popillia japonica TaxID=7064 RepID=A0AAW1IYT7_POPJA